MNDGDVIPVIEVCDAITLVKIIIVPPELHVAILALCYREPKCPVADAVLVDRWPLRTDIASGLYPSGQRPSVVER